MISFGYGIIIFLTAFLTNVAAKLYGVSFSDNSWVDSVIVGLVVAGVFAIIERFREKEKKK